MKIWIAILITSNLLWSACTPTQKENAVALWQRSLHEKNRDTKISMLDKALREECDYDFIALDLFILRAKQEVDRLKEEDIENIKNFKNDLEFPLSQLSFDQVDRHKFNLSKEIENLFVKFYEHQLTLNRSKSFSLEDKQKNRVLKEKLTRLNAPFSEKTFKAVTRIGGSYEVDLLFDVGKSNIKDHSLVKRIVKVIDEEVSDTPNALFGLEGGASSEGLATFNQALSKARAEALANEILKRYPHYKDNIKISAMGESELVCEGGLLPEENTKGEYECLTKEDRVKSRRVVIRRIR